MIEIKLLDMLKKENLISQNEYNKALEKLKKSSKLEPDIVD